MLTMSILIMFSTLASASVAPTGGIMDVLQVGRSALIVNIDRSQLPHHLRHETLTVSLIRKTDRATSAHETNADSLSLSLIGLADSVYIVQIKVHGVTFAEQEIVL